MLTPFHIAVAVHDLDKARAFYSGTLGLAEGRSNEHWIDFNMFGHQFVVHLDESAKPAPTFSAVDGDSVPVPHCGVVLPFAQWHALAAKLRAADQVFVIEPHIRFEGEPGEQGTMFFLDPSGNALEFKAFEDIDKSLFAT